jgi:hypothetical protein
MHMQRQLLTRVWAWEKSLLGLLELVGLVALVVYLSLIFEFVQGIQLVFQGEQWF